MLKQPKKFSSFYLFIYFLNFVYTKFYKYSSSAFSCILYFLFKSIMHNFFYRYQKFCENILEYCLEKLFCMTKLLEN